MREYETAPDLAMGLGAEFDADKLLATEFFRRPELDELLSYGWRPDDSTYQCTIPDRHPRRKELESLGRIEGPDPEHPHMLLVSRSEEPHYREVEFVRILRRGDDPADVMANMPEVRLCDHPAGQRCPTGASCYKNRFADRYNRWKAGEGSDSADGLPLSKVSFIDGARRMELEHRGVHTAEQLADLPADLVSKVPGLAQLQERVRRFSAAMKGTYDESKVNAKLQERDQRIAALEKQLQELQKNRR